MYYSPRQSNSIIFPLLKLLSKEQKKPNTINLVAGGCYLFII